MCISSDHQPDKDQRSAARICGVQPDQTGAGSAQTCSRYRDECSWGDGAWWRAKHRGLFIVCLFVCDTRLWVVNPFRLLML